MVAAGVELVVPTDDASEPCLNLKQFSCSKRSKSELNAAMWLAQRGKVYAAVDAA